MFQLYADKTKLAVRRREILTSGSINACVVRFEFSRDWKGLKRTAVFKGGGESRSVLLDETGECVIPWETLQVPLGPLEAGVYGTRDGTTVQPTVWANLGTILPGTASDAAAPPPTPELWEQELDAKADRMEYTMDGDLGLYSGERLLSAVPVAASGGESGVSDHRMLTGRDAQNQHPASAIVGLEEALSKIPVPMTADQLRKILVNGGN